MLGPAPAVGVVIPPNKEYSVLLQQTAQVYNQMLSNKCDKLLADLYQRKQKYDDECARLEAEDQARALEYGVKAQEELNQAQRQAEEQLAALQKDYQQKLIKMYQQLEDQWKQKHRYWWCHLLVVVPLSCETNHTYGLYRFAWDVIQCARWCSRNPLPYQRN